MKSVQRRKFPLAHQPSGISITYLDILRSGNRFLKQKGYLPLPRFHLRLGRGSVLGSCKDTDRKLKEVHHQGLYAPGTIVAKAFFLYFLSVEEMAFIIK